MEIKYFAKAFLFICFHEASFLASILCGFSQQWLAAGICLLIWLFTFWFLFFGYAAGENTIRKSKQLNKRLLKFSYIDNSILLKTEKITANGFHEIWRQRDEATGSTQILCYNSETEEFQAFDRYQWMEEIYPYDGRFTLPGPNIRVNTEGHKESLWTPIKLHCTFEWLKLWREAIRTEVE